MGHSCSVQLDILPQVVCCVRLSETQVWLVSMFPTCSLMLSWTPEIYFVTNFMMQSVCLLALLTFLISHHLPWVLMPTLYEQTPIETQ